MISVFLLIQHMYICIPVPMDVYCVVNNIGSQSPLDGFYSIGEDCNTFLYVVYHSFIYLAGKQFSTEGTTSETNGK